MSSRAEHYRCRGLEAQKRAAQTSEERVRDAFEFVADGWFLLAEELERREMQYKEPEANGRLGRFRRSLR
jgi:hypothetical protein